MVNARASDIMNFCGQEVCEKPEKLTPAQEADGKRHMARVRRLPCVICWSHGEQQNSRTTAHHVICGRYGNRRAPDTKTLPLCDGHHQGDFDTSKLAIHRDRSEWVAQYGEDTEYLAVVADMLANEIN